MLTRKPFDPLSFLEQTLEFEVYYSMRGTHIVLDGLPAPRRISSGKLGRYWVKVKPGYRGGGARTG